MVIKRVGPISCAKVLGLLYALIGFLVGAVISVLAVVVGGLVPDQGTNDQMFGALFGVGAIVLFPIFYGLMGLIGGGIGAVIYNFVASATGGLEIDVST